jgi:uncharacterized surface protein with fasciclin (FAS1) repeats
MNLKRFLTLLQSTLLVLVSVVTLSLTGCDGDDDNGPVVYDGSVLALINSDQYKQSSTVTADKALDSLAKYVNLYPELIAKLDGSADVTLFAPSNQAFINLIATPGFPTNIKLISPAIIESVLSYHIVEGKKMKADLSSGTVLETEFTDPLSPSAPQKITVNSNGTLVAAPNATNTDIDIVSSDILAKNGVVHIVESVMIPPSTGAVLVPILGKVAGTILLGKDFTNLAKVIMAADAGFTENPGTGQFKVSTWLAMPISNGTTTTANVSGITFFAPPNAVLGTPVLTEATANALIASDDKGRSFLLNHLVVDDQYQIADFADGVSTLTPVSGKTIYVNKGTASTNNPLGVALSNTSPPTAETFRPIVQGDIAHSNGVLHVFAGALQ